MELPDDVLAIIKEYAQPVTRPDWRTLHIMTQYEYINILKQHTILKSRISQNYFIKIKRIRFWLYRNC